MNPNFEITKSELFSIYNVVRAFARKNPAIIDPRRLNRALGILQSKDYYTSGDRDLYHPTIESCGCKDAQYWYSSKRGYRGACKHSIAEYIIALIIRRRADHTLPITVVAPREVYSDIIG